GGVCLCYCVRLVVLPAEQYSDGGMVKAPVTAHRVEVKLPTCIAFYLVVGEHKAACFAPLTQAVDLIALRVYFLSALHSGLVIFSYKAVVKVGRPQTEDISAVCIVPQRPLYPMLGVHRVKGQGDLIVQAGRQLTTQAVVDDLKGILG